MQSADAHSTSNWRKILRSQIFFHRRFSGEPTQIMRRKLIEYLGTDCFHFCRIPVELSVVRRRIQNVRSAPQNARITSYSIHVGPYTMAVASRWMWFDISPFFTDFSNSGVEYLAFLSQRGEKIVSSEPSNLRKKWVPGEMIFSPWWKSVEPTHTTLYALFFTKLLWTNWGPFRENKIWQIQYPHSAQCLMACTQLPIADVWRVPHWLILADYSQTE
jgi:hypothetical protein